MPELFSEEFVDLMDGNNLPLDLDDIIIEEHEYDVAMPQNENTGTIANVETDKTSKSVKNSAENILRVSPGTSSWSKYTPSMLRTKKKDVLKTPNTSKKDMVQSSKTAALKEQILQQQLDQARLEHDQKMECMRLEHEQRMMHSAEEHKLKMQILEVELKAKQT